MPKVEIPEEVEELFDEVSVFVPGSTKMISIRKPNGIEINDVSVFNMLGQQLISWDTRLDKNNIDLQTNMKIGVYLVMLNTNKGPISKKVMIK